MRPHRSLRCVGFTLVELLVVVAIISTMMSFLLPSITRAQKQGEGVHCLGNLRQIQLAWVQYATDSDDHLCDPRRFESRLQPFVNMPEVFLCKGVEDGRSKRAYAVSNTMGGERRDGVEPFAKLHHVSSPSSRLVCLDIEPGTAKPFWPIVYDANEWVWRPWSWPASQQGITDRHGNGCNMIFADGHAEQYHWRDMRTTHLIKGRIVDEVKASKENEDLDYMVRVLKGKD